MATSRFRCILAGLLMPLCAFSCVAFRDFQVRPHLGDPSRTPVSVASLAEDYVKVADAVKTWAAEQGLREVPCRYYSTPTATQPAKLQGLSPACHVFEGTDRNPYSVKTEFTPSNNATRLSVLASTDNSVAVDGAARKLKEYLASRFGAASISE